MPVNMNRKLISLFLIVIIMLSGVVVYQFCFPSVKGSSEYQNLGLLVSPDGKAFEIGVNQSKTFSVQALNGSEPFSYSWIIYPSGNFNLTVNEITYTVDAGSPILTYGSSLSLLFPHATQEYVSVQVKATDSNGVSGCLLQPFIVADPYTSPNYYFDASTASVSYIIQTDGLGWYRAIKGEDGSLYISSGSDPNTVFSSVFSACGNVGSVYVCDGNYAGASLVVPDGVRLILEQGVISLTYAIEASATTTILDYANGVFLSYSSGTLTSSIDLANGSITLTGNVVANNFESVEPIISYSCMVYLDGSTYKAKVNNGTVVATSSNITTIQELALSYVSSGSVYLKGVLFDYDVTIPEDVLLVESVDGLERKFINSANSQGSPYTISVDTVQTGYYMAQDSMGIFINSWTSTDVAATINNAYQAATSGVVRLNAGTYPCTTNTIYVNKTGVSLVGAGMNATILTFTSGGVQMGLNDGTDTAIYSNNLEDLQISGSDTADSVGLRRTNTQRSVISNVYINNFESGFIDESANAGIHILNLGFNIQVWYCVNGSTLQVREPASDGTGGMNLNDYYGLWVYSGEANSYSIKYTSTNATHSGPQGCAIYGAWAEWSTDGVIMENARGCQIKSLWLEHTTTGITLGEYARQAEIEISQEYSTTTEQSKHTSSTYYIINRQTGTETTNYIDKTGVFLPSYLGNANENYIGAADLDDDFIINIKNSTYVLRIWTANGASGELKIWGSGGKTYIYPGTDAKADLGRTSFYFDNVYTYKVDLKPYTNATLPSGSAAINGTMVWVADLNQLAIYNGTAWSYFSPIP